jgi:hypothetical protein
MSAHTNPPWGDLPPERPTRSPEGEPPRQDDPFRIGADAGDTGAAGGPGHVCVELCPICRGAELLRAAGPPGELRGQLDDVGREALLTLRALVDHYLERLDARPQGRGEVEEIPID